jgi:hypothetical protein
MQHKNMNLNFFFISQKSSRSAKLSHFAIKSLNHHTKYGKNNISLSSPHHVSNRERVETII